MAKRSSDTDSDGEYELMTSPNLGLTQSFSPAPTHDVRLLKIKSPASSPEKKGKSKGKRKGLLRRFSASKEKKKKKSSTSSTPVVVKEKVYLAKSVSRDTEPVASDVPPRPGPKPPKVLTEEELLEQLKQQQAERVAAARKERLRKISESEHQAKLSLDELNYTVDKSYGEVDIEDIVSRYSGHLPLKVVVSKGVYGMEEKYSLATSDKCVIHFIKRRELVQIQDPQRNTEFSVPLNTAIKFGVIYNPNNLMAQAMTGFSFKYVSDILAQTKMPKMGIGRLKDPNIIGVESAEVLVIKEVIFPENAADPRKLRVYSLTANCTRDLLETSEINLTTKPSLMQNYLPDLLKHIPDPVPLHVAMFRNPLSRPLVAPGIPATMFGRCMYLCKRFTDILLIATGCSSEGGSEEGESSENVGQPFEIPMDIDVDFEVIKLSEEEKEKLNADSKKLRERLNDKDVRHHRYVGMTDEQHRMQMSLYKSTREGTRDGAAGGGQKGGEDPDDDYVRATSGNRLPMNHRVELLEENIKRCCHSVGEAKATFDSLIRENTALSARVKDLEATVQEQGQRLKHVSYLEQQVASVYTDLDLLKTQLGSLVQIMKTPPKNTPTGLGRAPVPSPKPSPRERRREGGECATNQALLCNMTQSQIVQLFELVGLGHYKKVVMEEGITGDILIECDEEMMESELNIKSKTDRLTLLRVIEGKGDSELYSLGRTGP